jgi:nucleotide-binding universal stress UspA family protein
MKPDDPLRRRQFADHEAIMITLKRLLVATDFGDAADSALRYGRALARAFGAELHVVHVVDNVFARSAIDFGSSAIAPQVQEDLERASRRQVEGLLGDDDRRDLHAVTTAVTSLDPAEAIVHYARAQAVDLIVLGTHGRGAVAHLFLGNVAERVVRTAPCPVLTVRYPEHEFVEPETLVRAADAATGPPTGTAG